MLLCTYITGYQIKYKIFECYDDGAYEDGDVDTKSAFDLLALSKKYTLSPS